MSKEPAPHRLTDTSAEQDTPQEREARIQRIVQEFEKSLRQAFPKQPQTLEQIEDLTQQIGETIQQRIQEEMLKQQGRGDHGRFRRCCNPCCRRPARRRGMQERLVLARHGLVRLCRAYYYCEHCRGGFFPLDTQLALGQGQMSNTVAALLARFATCMSFRAAAKELKEVCHIEVAPSTVQRYARAIGEQMNRDWQAKETHLLKAQQASSGPEVFTGRPAPLQQVSLDGVLLWVEDGWHEAKIGCVFEPLPPRSDGAEAGVRHRHYCATLCASAGLGLRLKTLAAYQGVFECWRTAVVADGSEWIWQEASKHFARSVQILDFYHACAHLWTVARCRWGQDGPGSLSGAQWMEAQRTFLLADDVASVLSSLQDWQPCTAEGHEIARKALGYFAQHASRVRYHTFSEAGFHIGSGVVEAGCKSVVQSRMKGCGMRWSRPGAEAMLQLRAAWCSENGADFRQAARQTALA
jgi:hypothetical protein